MSRTGESGVSAGSAVWRREDGRPTTIGWKGDLPAALEALRGLPNGAGPAKLWAALAPDQPLIRLWAELYRLGVSERLMLSGGDGRCVDLQSAGEEDVHLTDLVGAVDSTELDVGGGLVAQVGGTVEQVWTGAVTDALARIATLPDNAGTDAFWSAFPDTE